MAAGSMTGITQGGGRRGVQPLALGYLALFVLLAAAAIAIAIFGNARDGEPSATIDIAPPPNAPQHRAVQTAPPSFKPTVPPANATVPAAIVPPVIGKAVYANGALIADPALIEQTSQGPLPRIADDGRTPMAAYAPAVARDGRPRIAIVVSGLGISAKATAAALAELPPGVTLAFAPYSDDAQRWVAEARRLGHEVLLEVPMEPFDFPDSDPGAQTLRVNVSEDANIQRLTWSMTRFTGYAGVTNLLGGRFLSDSDSLAPVMTFLARRGLFFFDGGASAHSEAPNVARQTATPFVGSDTTIDNIQTAIEIDARLSELESRARANGAASGSAFIYPISIERISAWAKSLSDRGFVLVPASAIVQPPK
jgi:hypothetical protein